MLQNCRSVPSMDARTSPPSVDAPAFLHYHRPVWMRARRKPCDV